VRGISGYSAQSWNSLQSTKIWPRRSWHKRLRPNGFLHAPGGHGARMGDASVPALQRRPPQCDIGVCFERHALPARRCNMDSAPDLTFPHAREHKRPKRIENPRCPPVLERVDNDTQRACCGEAELFELIYRCHLRLHASLRTIGSSQYRHNQPKLYTCSLSKRFQRGLDGSLRAAPRPHASRLEVSATPQKISAFPRVNDSTVLRQRVLARSTRNGLVH
jgi:hypothetical protein